MNAALEIRNVLKKQKPNTIFIASDLFKTKFLDKTNINEANYYKVLARLTKSEKIIKVSKGIYAVPKQGHFGILPISEDVIISSVIGNKEDGIEVGYNMYNRLRLTTQVGMKRVFFTNKIEEGQKKIGNILFIKHDLTFTKEVSRTVEILEILQNFSRIQDLDYYSFYYLMERYSKEYNDSVLKKVQTSIKYKKSTLAFLEEILNSFRVENNIWKYLSGLSKYNIPKWRRNDDFKL